MREEYNAVPTVHESIVRYIKAVLVYMTHIPRALDSFHVMHLGHQTCLLLFGL